MGYVSQGTEETGTPGGGLWSDIEWGATPQERVGPFLPSVSQTVMERAGKGCAVAAAASLHLWQALPSWSCCRLTFSSGALGLGSPRFSLWWCCWFVVNAGLDGSLKRFYFNILLWKCPTCQVSFFLFLPFLSRGNKNLEQWTKRCRTTVKLQLHSTQADNLLLIQHSRRSPPHPSCQAL